MSDIQPQVDLSRNNYFNYRLLGSDPKATHALGMKKAKVISLLGLRIKSRLSTIKDGSQTWLADKLDISNNAVSKWISGDSQPSMSNLQQMAAALKCSVGYLAGDQQSESIAKVVAIMEEQDEEGREAILNGVIGITASRPQKTKSNQQKRLK